MTCSFYDFINKEKDPCEMMSTLPQDVLLGVCGVARAVKDKIKAWGVVYVLIF